MKRLASLATLVLAVAAVAPATLQAEEGRSALAFASNRQTFAVMVNRPGQFGANFLTHVSLMNPTRSSFTVTARLYDTTGVPRTATITLGAGQFRTYENFVDAVFGGTFAGAVVLESPRQDDRFIVSAEVRTQGAAGWYGTYIPALEFAGTTSPSFAAGIYVDSATRSNLGCYNQWGSENRIKATVYDAAGHSVGSQELVLPANGWNQQSVSGAVTGGYVVFEPAGPALCYAVVVDNSTNDGRFISAAEYLP